MHYSAIGITTHDLQMGIPFLKKLEEEASFPFLSTTIVRDNTPIFTPYTIISKNNLSIGVIGITAQTQAKSTTDYKILEWQQPLTHALGQLAYVDLIIVLSNLSHEENRHIAKSYHAVNIILEAGQPLGHKGSQLIDNTLFSHTQKEGKYIGELQINWQPSKTWLINKNPVIQLKNEIDRLKWLQNRIRKNGGPAKAYKNKPASLQSYNKKMQHLHDLQLQLAASRTGPSQDHIPSTYEAILHPLKPSIHDEQQTTRILKRSRKAANNLRKKNKVLKYFDNYGGSTSCKKCHGALYSEYKATGHSKAYATLVHKSAENNPNCIFCHVTGLPERLAYNQATVPKRLLEVGCETCHGAGKKHIGNPKKYKLTATVPETTCLACHTDEHSDDFNYSRDIGLVH